MRAPLSYFQRAVGEKNPRIRAALSLFLQPPSSLLDLPPFFSLSPSLGTPVDPNHLTPTPTHSLVPFPTPLLNLIMLHILGAVALCALVSTTPEVQAVPLSLSALAASANRLVGRSDAVFSPPVYPTPATRATGDWTVAVNKVRFFSPPPLGCRVSSCFSLLFCPRLTVSPLVPSSLQAKAELATWTLAEKAALCTGDLWQVSFSVSQFSLSLSKVSSLTFFPFFLFSLPVFASETSSLLPALGKLICVHSRSNSI